MKHTKLSARLLAMLLAVIMAVSVVPTGAFATEGSDPSEPPVVAVESVVLDQTALSLTVEGTATLAATVFPENATDKAVTWASDNDAVATVADGLVTAVAAGTANITAAAGEFSATCAVTVVEAAPETVAVESVSLDKAELSLTGGGETATLTATVAPAEATDKTVTWTSSDSAVVTVENGVVTAVTAGNATITVTTTDGAKTASCAVTVSAKEEGGDDEGENSNGNQTGDGNNVEPAPIDDGIIDTADELSTAIQNAVSGDTITLGGDITLPTNWEPITLDTSKSLVINGNGKTVKLQGTALFNGVYSGNTVKNLTVTGTASGNAGYNQYNMGPIAITLSGTIENCVSYASVAYDGQSVGGIVGAIYNPGKVENCVYLGSSVTGTYVGAISGACYSTIKNCWWISDSLTKADGANSTNVTGGKATTAEEAIAKANGTYVEPEPDPDPDPEPNPNPGATLESVYLTVYNKGVFATANGNFIMYRKAVTVTDLDGDERFSLNEALVAAHKAYNAEDGYTTEGNAYGSLDVTKLWGIENNGCYGFYKNNVITNTVDQEFVAAGDSITAFIYYDVDGWSDRYSYFTEASKTVTAGEEFTLTLQYADWSGGSSPVATAPIGAFDMSTGGYYVPDTFRGEHLFGDYYMTASTGTNGTVTLSITEPGTYYVTAEYNSSNYLTYTDYGTSPNYLVPPICIVTVTATSGGGGDTPEPTDPNAPVEINSAEQLAGLDLTRAGSYKLMTDLTLPSDWTPMFMGLSDGSAAVVFDGNGHTINVNGVSPFNGVYTGSTIRNLMLKGTVNSSGKNQWGSNNNTGAIAGALSGVIQNCISYVAVTGPSGCSVGGLIGSMYSGSISNCAMLGTAASNYGCGAVVGYSGGGTAENCWWTADITSAYGNSTSAVSGGKTTEVEAITAVNAAASYNWPVPAPKLTALRTMPSATPTFSADVNQYTVIQESAEDGIWVQATADSGTIKAVYGDNEQDLSDGKYKQLTWFAEYGDHPVQIVVENGGQFTTYTLTVKYVDPANAAPVLSDLTFLTSDVQTAMTPGLAADTFAYTVILKSTVQKPWVRMNAPYCSITAAYGDQTDVPVENDNWTQFADFPTTNTVLTLTVTNQAGASNTYTVNVNRPEPAKLTGLGLYNGDLLEALDPAFDPNVFSGYTLALKTDRNTLSVQAQAAEGSTVKVCVNNGTLVSLSTAGWSNVDFNGIYGDEIPMEIYVTDASGNMGTYQFKVKHPAPPPESITLDHTALTVIKGEFATLTATIAPENAVQEVIWTTSNENIAAVDASGKVTAVDYGTATITATVKEDPTLLATCEITVDRVQLNGSGTAQDPYLITTQAEAEAFRDLVNGGVSFQGSVFSLEASLALPPDWVPVGTVQQGTDYYSGESAEYELNAFKGTFHGNNHTIYVDGGLTFFGTLSGGARVDNLNIQGGKIAGNGVVAYYCTGQSYTLDNITLKSGTQTLKSGFLGGYGNDSVTIQNCKVESGVTVGYDGQQSRIGSFAGDFNGIIKNCTSGATVKGKDFVGGIVGGKSQSMTTFTISGCTFSGAVIASGNYVGGISGAGYTGTGFGIDSAPNAICASITNCTVTGSVTGGNYVGGILGAEPGVVQCWDNGVGEISNNKFTGKELKATSGSYVGGIIGYMKSLNRYNVISGNEYSAASKGIGGVTYVDTNYENPTSADGTTYVDTSKAIPAISGFGQNKSNHNRTDDPLGKDAYKLAKPFGAEEKRYMKALKVSDTCNYKNQYKQGEDLDLTGIELFVVWSDKEEEQISHKDVTVTGYDKDTLGYQRLTLTYERDSDKVSTTIDVKVESDDEINVYFTLLGDSTHGSGGTKHTLVDGNLSTWVGYTEYTLKKGSTVLDLMTKAAADKGFSFSGSSYISSVNGLSALDNGPDSGWMYTLNGYHPGLGVSEQQLKDGDSVVFHYTDDYNREYGKDSEKDKVTVKEVIALINAIGTVKHDGETRQKIDAARVAYDALSYAEKKQVTNYSVLVAAEKKYEELKKADDLEKAKEVDALIAKIGTPITEKSEAAITAARTAYDALTPEQKALVKNLKTLTDAEADFAALSATEEDKAKAKAVSDLIDALGEITLESEEKIKEVREAYDKLTDLQKKLVKNYDVLEAAEKELERLKEQGKYEDAFVTTSAMLEKLPQGAGAEWVVLGLARSGGKVHERYGELMHAYIRENVDENNRLHRSKSTENARMILALTAVGIDATDVDGIDLVAGLNEMAYLQKQGINGPIWALIALDSGNYPDPKGGDVTRESLIDVIWEAQCEDGGWALAGDLPEPDLTGMALQALAPYYETDEDVRLAVDTALEVLSEMQNKDGSFSTGGSATSESISQVIVALTALGIHPDTDERFIKNGNSALDALLSFYVEGGGFKHLLSGKVNDIATEQAYYALTAYDRFLKGETRLYDMTDVFDKAGINVANPEPVVIEPQEPAKAPAPVEVKEKEQDSDIALWFFSGLERVLSWFL